jgi:hypothetical protein
MRNFRPAFSAKKIFSAPGSSDSSLFSTSILQKAILILLAAKKIRIRNTAKQAVAANGAFSGDE